MIKDSLPKPCIAPQRSADWYDARRGVPTASQFKRLCREDGSPNRDGWFAYSCELIGDLMSPEFPRWNGNADTRRGTEYEPVVTEFFAKSINRQILPCPFYRCGPVGASPDGIIAEQDGRPYAGLEIKSPRPVTHAKTILQGTPAEHLPQIHGGMIVTKLRRWFFVSACPGAPLFYEEVRWSQFTENLVLTLDSFMVYHAENLRAFRAAKACIHCPPLP